MREIPPILLAMPWETILTGFVVALPVLFVRQYFPLVLFSAFAPAIIGMVAMYVLLGLTHGVWWNGWGVPERAEALEIVIAISGYVVGGLCAAHLRILWPSTAKKS